MHGCGWDSGAARERSSALAASVASRYATRSAPKAGALRARAQQVALTLRSYLLPPRDTVIWRDAFYVKHTWTWTWGF